jgi:hypothetical protein
MLLMFWFPPVAFVGLAALSAAGLALRDATSGAQDEVSSLA